MMLLRSWLDSLRFFAFFNIKNFFNELGRTYKTWVIHWWWLLALVVAGIAYGFGAAYGIFPNIGCWFEGWKGRITLFIAALPFALFLCSLFRSALSSITLKDRYPAAHGFVRIFWFLLRKVGTPTSTISEGMLFYEHVFGVVIWLMFVRLTMLAAKLCHVPESFLLFPIIWLTVFFMLFLFNSSLTERYWGWKSWYRALKMLVYNLPYCLVISFLLGFLYLSFVVGIMLTLPTLIGDEISFLIVGLGLVFIFLPIFVILATNFYVKRLPEQYGLYFKE